MPLDHFVSQVHLKNFNSPALGNRMYALRKSDMKEFTPDASSVCRIHDGNTNSYLSDERVIEEFLKGIEPRYNKTIAKLSAGSIDNESIYILSGFIAYITACSPAGIRIHAELFKNTLEEQYRFLDATGRIPPPPPELGGASLSELLDKGIVATEVDAKYPQAIGISTILQRLNHYGNASWEILINEHKDSPFFTSDYPVTIEKTTDNRIVNKIVPLSPYLAVRIRPNISTNPNTEDFAFPHFSYKVRRPRLQEIAKINTLIVRCAETIVFFRDNHEWIHKFVRKHSPFRIETRSYRLTHNTGFVLINSQVICGP